MSISHDLFVKKHASAKAATRREKYEAKRLEVVYMGLFGSVIIGLVSIFMIVGGVQMKMPDMTVLGMIGSITSAAGLALVGFLYFNKGDAPSLKAEEAATHAEYESALHAEMHEYGIDPQSITARTTEHDSSYDFTALRDGVLCDVSVREYGNELVFMLNGERMRKTASV